MGTMLYGQMLLRLDLGQSSRPWVDRFDGCPALS
jgi:hypothetical protein